MSRSRRSPAYTLLEILLVLAILVVAMFGVLRMWRGDEVQAAAQKEQVQQSTLADAVRGMYAMAGSYAGVSSQVVAQQHVNGLSINSAGVVSAFGSGIVVQPSTVKTANDAFQVVYKGLSHAQCVALIPAVAGDAYAITIGSSTTSVVSQDVAGTGQVIDPSVVSSECAAEPDAAGVVTLTYYTPRPTAAALAGAPACTSACAPQTQTQQLACPGAEVGHIEQTRSGTCVGAPCPTLTWSAWSTTASSCSTAPTQPGAPTTPTPPTPSCSPSTAYRAQSCPAGQSGRIWQEQDTVCMGGTPTVEPWTTISNGCVTPIGNPATGTGCTTHVVSGTAACPAGQGGQITTKQDVTCDASGNPVYGPVTPVSNTCQTSCALTGTCCTVGSQPGPQENVPCAPGQYGQIIDGTTEYSTCGSATGTPAWGSPQITSTSGSCAACPPPSTVNVACPAGMTGSATQTTAYNCSGAPTSLPAPTVTTDTSACVPATPACATTGGPGITVTPIDLTVDQVGDKGAVVGAYGSNGVQSAWTGSATVQVTYQGATSAPVHATCTTANNTNTSPTQCLGPATDVTVGGQSFGVFVVLIGPTPSDPSLDSGDWQASVGVTQNSCLHWITRCNSIVETSSPANATDTNGRGQEAPVYGQVTNASVAVNANGNGMSGDGPNGNPWSVYCNITGSPAAVADPTSGVSVPNPGAGNPTAPWSTLYSSGQAWDGVGGSASYGTYLNEACSLGQSRLFYTGWIGGDPYLPSNGTMEVLYDGQSCSAGPVDIYSGPTGYTPPTGGCPATAGVKVFGKSALAAAAPPGCP